MAASSCAAGKQLHWARRGVYALLAAIRPDAVALVDAFGFEDYLLNSALGRRDGDVYRCSFCADRSCADPQQSCMSSTCHFTSFQRTDLRRMCGQLMLIAGSAIIVAVGHVLHVSKVSITDLCRLKVL
jgi:hypothetical protein